VSVYKSVRTQYVHTYTCECTLGPHRPSYDIRLSW